MTTLLICNVLLLWFLSTIWNRTDWKNLLLKLVLIVMTAANGFALLLALGYAVRA